jgi:hypothetical protein
LAAAAPGTIAAAKTTAATNNSFARFVIIIHVPSCELP